MILDPCSIPPTTCDRWDLQSPDMQKYLLIQLLNSLLNVPLDLSVLKTYGAYYNCQGSPAKISAIWANTVVENLRGVDEAQPVCWTPNELEGALAYLICQLASSEVVT